MRLFLFATLLAVASPLAAQAPQPRLEYGRPAFATMGKEMFPMMMIDEMALDPARFVRIPFPAERWAEEKACLAGLGVRVDKVGSPPDILLVPSVRTFRVHDMTLDSLLYAEDSTYTGEFWAPPTVGYAMIHSNLIIVTSPYRANPYVLRHEALHFMLWRQKLAILGHPKEFFMPCDEHYEPKLGLKPNNDWR